MDIDGRLRALNVPRDAYRVVSLLPLVYVASADGKIQKVERDVILRIPRENGLLEHGGEDALDRWLSDPPTKEQLKTDLAILNELARNDRGGMNGFGADEEQLLLAWCQDVADAAGGMLGLGRARTDAETAALKTIAGALDMRNAGQWRAALKT